MLHRIGNAHRCELRSQCCLQRQQVDVQRPVSASAEECSCLGDVLLCVPPSRWWEKEPRSRGACSGMRYYQRNSGVVNNTYLDSFMFKIPTVARHGCETEIASTLMDQKSVTLSQAAPQSQELTDSMMTEGEMYMARYFASVCILSPDNKKNSRYPSKACRLVITQSGLLSTKDLKSSSEKGLK